MRSRPRVGQVTRSPLPHSGLPNALERNTSKGRNHEWPTSGLGNYTILAASGVPNSLVEGTK